MRLKGFFWFLTITLVTVCVYQLSFTWVANNVENDAEKTATVIANQLKKKAELNGDSTELNGVYIHFDSPEGFDLAKASIINNILKEKSEGDQGVYPLIGSSFKVVKKRSLAFGLDLVGGMSVTLEISTPELIKNHAKNPRDLKFVKPFDKAVYIHNSRGGDFLTTFIDTYKEINGNLPLSYALKGEGIGIKSSDSEVESYFRKMVSSSLDGVEQIMSRRINQFGVAQPNIQKDLSSNRLYIELPGVQDENTVAQKLQSTANLEFFETFLMSQIQNQWDEAANISIRDEIDLTISDTIKTDSLKKESSSLSLTNSSTKKKGLNELLEFKSYTDPNTNQPKRSDNEVGYAFFDDDPAKNDKAKIDEILKRKDVMSVFPQNLKFMWSAEPEEISDKIKKKAYVLYACKVPEGGKARVNGSHIDEARTGYDQRDGKITVNLEMTADGADEWGQMTTENKEKIIAISMDNVVYSAPRVNDAILTGSTQISGDFTFEEAEDLAGLLNGGALPAPCVIKELQKVGPTIGKENSKAGLISFAFAFLAVLIYMYFYYGKAGLAANIALTVNVVLIFGSLASFGAVLTLAGIAGIVLTIGTAVDANILIFERIREEQNRGLDLASSVDVGFKKALPSIIDANVTHLLVAIILKIFGTGEIESFATTLIIGIFTSLFSAIIISELVIHAWLDKGKSISFNTNMSKGWFQNFKFDWVGKRKYFYIFSISVTILGIVSLSTRSLKQSVEFTGGRTFVVKFDKKADTEYIRANLEKVFVENKETASIDLKTKSNDYNVEIITNYLLKKDGANEEVNKKLNEGLTACKDRLGNYKIVESRSISASISSELWKSSAIAISLSLVAIFAYILLRFGHWQYSIGAIVGLAHDAFFVISIFSLLHGFLPFSLDINQAFIAAILTVIGYSMNDTVIVFDRIRENLKNSGENDHHYEIINKSLNTTLSRTFNTSMILFVVVLIMFIFGGPAIKGFLFALLVGVVIGTYSSLCVATPILIDFSKRLKA
jgi:SecD/SecF fusion protein